MIRPTLFLLHALGSSAREWDGVIEALGPAFDAVPLDLPGSATPLATIGPTSRRWSTGWPVRFASGRPTRG